MNGDRGDRRDQGGVEARSGEVAPVAVVQLHAVDAVLALVRAARREDARDELGPLRDDRHRREEPAVAQLTLPRGGGGGGGCGTVRSAV